jgi:UDP-N-acetylmuramoyl-tripeptide--D-alanyl-D-alanine ligase
VTGWTLGDIATCLGVPALAGVEYQPESPLSGVSTDSRTLERGSLFVPLVGEKFDGHDYARKAVQERGATAVVWSREEIPEWLASGAAVFRVNDTLDAYQALGLYWKKKCGVRAIAVTGSVGKTTTKEFLAHFLEPHFSIHKSRANFNNDIGVPKTLLELTPDHELVIVEMGMRGRHEIARLVRAAEPEVGVITAIGTSHIELLGSRENIARAKGELVEGLPADGYAVLPSSDSFYSLLKDLSVAPVAGYSAEPSTEGLCPQAVLREDEQSTVFTYQGREYTLPLPGRHHLHDFFAVLAVGRSLGLEPETLLENIGTLGHPEGRAEWLTIGGARFYMDAYNSAPESLHASLGVLKACDGRRLAVLGDMLELGEVGPGAHREVGEALPDYGVDLVLGYGPLTEQLIDGARSKGVSAHWYEEKPGLAEHLQREIQQGVYVLVKASRGMALETVVNTLKERVG